MHIEQSAQSPDPITLIPKKFWQTDSGRLGLAGAALLGLAIFFGWNELALSPAYLLPFAGALLLAASIFARHREGQLAVSVALVLVAAPGVVWQTFAPMLPLALGLLMCGAAGVLHLVLHHRRARAEQGQGAHLWMSGALTALAASWAAYYQFIALGVAAETSIRRLVITLVWLLAGLGGMAHGTRRDERPVRNAGALVVAVAIGKALFYDTTHLAGMERIGLCALAGLVLVAAATIVRIPRRA